MILKQTRRALRSPGAFLVRLSFLIVALHTVAAAQDGRNDNWISTWSTATIGRVPPAAPATTTALPLPPAPAATATTTTAPGLITTTAPQATTTQAPAGRGGAAPVLVNNQTLRQIVRTTFGGDRFRIVVANTFGTGPLEIGAAHAALRATGSTIAPGGRPVSFSGRPTATVPQGATLVSDPIALALPHFADVAIDLYFPGNAGAMPATTHPAGLQTNYVSGEGNHAGSVDLPVARTATSWYYLSRVEVAAPSRTVVIVALGDSITDGTASTVDANNRWPNLLAKRMATERNGRRAAVVNAGIAGNRVLSDSTANFGANILARFDRDVLAQPGATHVIFMLGINDIGGARTNPAPSAADLIAGHRQVIARARAAGLKIIGATLTPFEGAAYYTPVGEVKRQELNTWIRTGKEYDGIIDFDAATRDPNAMTRFLPAYDSGDHLHPSDAGYEAMAKAIDLFFFR